MFKICGAVEKTILADNLLKSTNSCILSLDDSVIIYSENLWIFDIDNVDDIFELFEYLHDNKLAMFKHSSAYEYIIIYTKYKENSYSVKQLCDWAERAELHLPCQHIIIMCK